MYIFGLIVRQVRIVSASLGTRVCIPCGAQNARSASINTFQVEYAMTYSPYVP